MILQAFQEAHKKILHQRGLVGVLYVASLLVAAVLTLPLRAELEILGRTALAQSQLNGFYLDHLIEFWSRHAGGIQALFRAALGVGLLYVLINTFFAGGLLSMLGQERAFQLRDFLREGAAFFGRYFRLLLVSLLVLAAFVAAFGLGVVRPLAAYAGGPNDAQAFRVYLLLAALGLFMLGVWNMLFDYAKIAINARNSRSAVLGFFAGTGFALRHPLRCTALYFLNFGIVLLLFALYLAIESLFNNATAAQTFSLLAIQQIFIVSRLWMKLSFFASQQEFYFIKKSKAPGLPATAQH